MALQIPGFVTRAATPDDAGAVTELINAAEVVDIGEAMLGQSDVDADWASPSLDLALDTLLVFEGGRMVAAAQVSAERADIDVHPEHRGRGIGTALINWSEERARTQAKPGVVPRVGQTVPTEAADIVDLLNERGYDRLWESWVLRFPVDAELPPAEVEGVEIRPYRTEEEHAAFTIIDTAFSEWDGRQPQPFAEWQSMVTKRPDFDPSLLLVAVVDDELVGAAYGINYPDEGWIDKIAVDRDHRGRGIASAMLATLFTEFRSQGVSLLGLNTDSRTGALDLYLRLGMKVEHSYTRWSRAL